jgi:ADP-ribosylglycohydrolase
MKENAKAMVLASFVGDSLSLGAHWIYDTDKIVKTFGRVETLLKPLEKSFHAGKDKGEFTHYGDQTYVLLESVAAKKGFDPEDFAIRWQEFFKDYPGYFDKATKATRANFSSGKSFNESGSSSTDLAGAARIAPLVYCYQDHLDQLVEASRVQTKMTHNNPQVVEGSAFFAKVTWKVLQGNSPIASLEEAAQEGFSEVPISQWVEEGLKSIGSDTLSVISRFGQTCHAEDAFPGVIHLIAKYEDDLKEALIENVMAGGDSAARGMVVGMVLGAHLGQESLPEEWASGLKKHKQILNLLSV